MDAWDGWETGRVVLLLAAVMYTGIWVQLSLFHWAGAFKRRVMWGPVLVTPLFVVAAILGAVEREGILGWLALGLLALGIVEGMTGLFFHLQGMGYQVGGLRSVRNLLAGPPPMLPMAYSIVGVIGIVGLVWNA